MHDRMFPTVRHAPPRASACRSAVRAFLVAAVLTATDGATDLAAAPAPAEATSPAAAERLKLATSDGMSVAAWFYAPVRAEADKGEETEPAPVVILLHDLGGSHKSVQQLAQELQTQGIAVVSPDLRGHGETAATDDPTKLEPQSLRKPDFDCMVMAGGGQVRTEASRRGEVETVRNWIRQHAVKHALDADRLVVVGSGVGAAVAAQWTVLDAKWPPLASGPQGGEVRGLVFVSPAWTTRGFTIGPALTANPVRKDLPILVIAGGRDADAVKVYDQLKRQRPEAIRSEKRAGQATAVTADPRTEEQQRRSPDVSPSLYLRQFDADITGDRLASVVPKERAGSHPAAIIAAFVGVVTAGEE